MPSPLLNLLLEDRGDLSGLIGPAAGPGLREKEVAGTKDTPRTQHALRLDGDALPHVSCGGAGRGL